MDKEYLKRKWKHLVLGYFTIVVSVLIFVFGAWVLIAGIAANKGELSFLSALISLVVGSFYSPLNFFAFCFTIFPMIIGVLISFIGIAILKEKRWAVMISLVTSVMIFLVCLSFGLGGLSYKPFDYKSLTGIIAFMAVTIVLAMIAVKIFLDENQLSKIQSK